MKCDASFAVHKDMLFESDELSSIAFEYSQDAIFVSRWMDRNVPGPFMKVNARFCEQSGYTKEELYGITPFDVIDMSQEEAVRICSVLSANNEILFSTQYTDINGCLQEIEVSACLKQVKGCTLLLGVARDISRCIRAAGRLTAETVCGLAMELSSVDGLPQDKKGENTACFGAMPDTILRISREGVFLDVTIGRETDLLFPPEMFIGKHVYDILPKTLAKKTMQHIRQTYDTGSVQCYEYTTRMYGERRCWETRLMANGADEVLAIVRDVTAGQRMVKRLKYLSLHDSLTGIYNRAYLEEVLEQMGNEHSASVGVLMCDVDRLKYVNDTMGHSSGDSLLIEAANVIKQALRKGDIAARVGGDEFVIVLPCADVAACAEIYRRIKDGVKRHNEAKPHFPISISVGYAVRDDASTKIADLLVQADSNMYREKSAAVKK